MPSSCRGTELRTNAIANYIGQAYGSLIGIVMVPIYLEYLGSEAYGLVGFFAVLQSWLLLLDLGLSPTLSRQLAHARARDGRLAGLHPLVRSVALVALPVGIAIVLGVWAAGPWIAKQWLKAELLPVSDMVYCVALMGGIVALRWFSSLCRSGIQGMERQVWLNGVNIVFATAGAAAAWVLLRWISQEVTRFFELQLALSAIEFGLVGVKFYRELPTRNAGDRGFSLQALRAVLPFAAGVAYTSAIWTLLTQVDKLLLSYLLPLREFAYFALVAVAANAILSFSGPLTQALLPRMTVLLSQGNNEAMLDLYRKATQFVAASLLPLAGILAVFSSEVLYAWTGNKDAAAWGGPVLSWFALGNGILSISAFQYYLQYAHGKLRLHAVYTTVSALVQVPIIIYAALEYGAIGVAIAWFCLRLTTFLIWPPIVHSHFAPGIHGKWLRQDIAPALTLTALALGLAAQFRVALQTAGRVEILVVLGIVAGVLVVANMLASRMGRGYVLKLLRS